MDTALDLQLGDLFQLRPVAREPGVQLGVEKE